MVKSCGGCHYWAKWTNDKWGRGLCDALDITCRSDSKACEEYKAIPYKYKKKYELDKRDLEQG
mgnify:CR=1 FL=1